MRALEQNLLGWNPEGSKRPRAPALCSAGSMVKMAPLDLNHLQAMLPEWVWTHLIYQPLKHIDVLENVFSVEPRGQR